MSVEIKKITGSAEYVIVDGDGVLERGGRTLFTKQEATASLELINRECEVRVAHDSCVAYLLYQGRHFEVRVINPTSPLTFEVKPMPSRMAYKESGLRVIEEGSPSWHATFGSIKAKQLFEKRHTHFVNTKLEGIVINVLYSHTQAPKALYLNENKIVSIKKQQFDLLGNRITSKELLVTELFEKYSDVSGFISVAEMFNDLGAIEISTMDGTIACGGHVPQNSKVEHCYTDETYERRGMDVADFKISSSSDIKPEHIMDDSEQLEFD